MKFRNPAAWCGMTLVLLSTMAWDASAQCVGWRGLSVPVLQNSGPEIRSFASLVEDGVPVVYASSADNLGISYIFRNAGAGFQPIAIFRGEVRALAAFDDGTGPALVVAGIMNERSNIGATVWTPASNVMRYSGQSWTPMGDLRSVYALSELNGVLYAGGSFVRENGGPGDRVARWDGSAWQALVDEPRPARRSSHAMAYDPTRGRVVLFGGLNVDRLTLGDTWEWDGAHWHQIPVSGPSARFGHAMFYDTSRQRVMVFGGCPSSINDTPAIEDMWSWDGAVWNPVAQSGSPPARFQAGSSFDEARAVLVLNGGKPQVGDPALRETWEWQSATGEWTRPSVIGPFQTSGQGMAFDPATGTTIMYGGLDRGSRTQRLFRWTPATATWVLSTPAGPAARAATCFFRDPLLGGFVTYGGGSIDNSENPIPLYEDVWRYNGTAWSQVMATSSPGIRAGAAMAYDQAHARHVMFGGVLGGTSVEPRVTWLFDGTTWSAPEIGEPDGPVKAMTVHDDGTGPALYIAGSFTRCGPHSARGIAKWTGSAWQSLGDGAVVAGDAYFAMRSHTDSQGPALYLGADLTNAAGTTTMKAARLRDGSWTNISAGLVTVPQAFGELTINGQATLLCGSRGGVDGQGNPIGGLRWDGTAWVAAYGGVRGEIRAFHAPVGSDGSVVYAGGNFTHAGGQTATKLATLGLICDPVVFTQQPANVVAEGSQSVYFTVTVTGTGPLSYQWRRDGQPLTDSVDRIHIAGSSTANLALHGWSIDDEGVYDCVATGAVGPVVSSPATLTVPGTSPPAMVSVETVALLPRQAPGYPAGNVWQRFFSMGVGLAPDGRALIAGYSQGPDIGNRFLGTMATGGAAPLSIIADATDSGPAPLGHTFLAFGSNSKAIVGGGYVVTAAMETHVPFQPATAILRVDAAGSWSVIAGTGLPAGTPGQTFGLIFESEAEIGDSGATAFLANVLGIGPQPVICLYYWSPEDGLRRIAAVGDTLPGGGSPVTSFDGIAIESASGRMWSLVNTGTSEPIVRLYDWTGTELIPHIGTNDPLPDGAVGDAIGWVRPPLLAAGTGCVFHAEIHNGQTDMGHAVFRADDEGVRVLVRSGDAALDAPEPGATFRSLQPLAANDAAMVVLKADTYGPCPDCEPPSTWLLDESGIRLIGWRAVRPAGWQSINPPVRLAHARINARGEVLLADLGNRAVFGWTDQAGLFTIAGAGTQINIGGGLHRTVSVAAIPSVTPGTSCIDDQGRLLLTPTLLANEGALAEFRFNDFLTAFHPCPSITRDPSRTVARSFASTSLSVVAGGLSGLTYRWKKNGAELFDGPASEGLISGAASPELIISGVRSDAFGDYSVVVSNACGAVESASARLDVRCVADYNDDGGIDGQDIAAFFEAWESGLPEADITDDGGVDGADVELFFFAWEGGGC